MQQKQAMISSMLTRTDTSICTNSTQTNGSNAGNTTHKQNDKDSLD